MNGICLLGLMIATSSDAATMKSVAHELAAGARRSGAGTVAVLPMSPADGSLAAEGWHLSEKLITQLVRQGKVQVVERSYLSRVMSEHQLTRSGAIDPKSLKKLGQLVSADAVVTGSFVTSGRRAKLQARLVNVETGLIMAASEAETERDDEALAGWTKTWSPQLEVAAPELMVQAPPLPGARMIEMRDAPADDTGCERAAERVDDMESRVLELKARYWAQKLRDGLDPRTLLQNPGSTISDRELKSRFYARLSEWHRSETIPAMTPSEVARFVAVDGEAYALHRKCGL